MHVVAAPGKTETEHPRRAEEKRLCYLALRVQRADGAPDTPGQGDYLGPTLSNPMDHSLPGYSVHGIFQTRALEWGAIAFSGMDVRVGL